MAFLARPTALPCKADVLGLVFNFLFGVGPWFAKRRPRVGVHAAFHSLPHNAISVAVWLDQCVGWSMLAGSECVEHVLVPNFAYFCKPKCNYDIRVLAPVLVWAHVG